MKRLISNNSKTAVDKLSSLTTAATFTEEQLRERAAPRKPKKKVPRRPPSESLLNSDIEHASFGGVRKKV